MVLNLEGFPTLPHLQTINSQPCTNCQVSHLGNVYRVSALIQSGIVSEQRGFHIQVDW